MSGSGLALAREETTAAFGIGGARIDVRSALPGVLDAIRARLRRLPADDSTADVRIDVEVGAGRRRARPSPAGAGRRIYDLPVGDALYHEADDTLSIRYGDRVRATCDLRRARAWIDLAAPNRDCVWLATHPMFTLSLVELLRRRGLFALHAAALALDGRALLVAGASGAGKSTLTLALLRAGFGFMGDDTCFVRTGDDGVRVIAFPDEVDVSAATIGFFPELRFLAERAPRPGADKRALLPEEAYDVAYVSESAPGTIVFPRIGPSDRSVLEPMSAAEALLELVPNVLLTEPRRAQTHLDAIGAVVGASRCYRLQTGRDFDALPAMLRALMESFSS